MMMQVADRGTRPQMPVFRPVRAVQVAQPCALVIGELDVAFTDALHHTGVSVIAMPSLVAGEALAVASLDAQRTSSPTIVILAPHDTYGQETWPLAAQLTIWMQEGVIQPAWIVMPIDTLNDQSRTRAERAGCVCVATPRTQEEIAGFVHSTFNRPVQLDPVDPAMDASMIASIRRERAGFRDAAAVLYDTIRRQQQQSRQVRLPASDDVWGALRLFVIPPGYLKDDIQQRAITVFAVLGGRERTYQLLREFSETLTGSDKKGLVVLLAHGSRDDIANAVGFHPDSIGRIWLRKIAQVFTEWLTYQHYPQSFAA